jgi:hypothetical protein
MSNQRIFFPKLPNPEEFNDPERLAGTTVAVMRAWLETPAVVEAMQKKREAIQGLSESDNPFSPGYPQEQMLQRMMEVSPLHLIEQTMTNETLAPAERLRLLAEIQKRIDGDQS